MGSLTGYQKFGSCKSRPEFGMSAIRPSEVKRGSLSTSAPGDDGVSYFHLKELPSCHNF